MIRKFVSARERGDSEVVLWGDGSPTREFLYVEDAAEGIVLAAERYDSSDPVNLGSGHRDPDPRPGREASRRRRASRAASSGTPASPTVSRAAGWTSRAPRSDSASRRARPFDRGIAATVAYYEEHQKEIDRK